MQRVGLVVRKQTVLALFRPHVSRNFSAQPTHHEQREKASLLGFFQVTFGGIKSTLINNRRLLVQLGLWLSVVSIGMQVQRTKQEALQEEMLFSSKRRELEENIFKVQHSQKEKEKTATLPQSNRSPVML